MITYLLAGLLGLLFTTLAKMQGVKKLFKVANEQFSVKKFFFDEWIGIAMSIVVILLMAITIKEWQGVNQQVDDHVTIIFALGGAIGSWAFLLFLGNSRKYIRKVIDVKTNIADGLPPPDQDS